MFARIVRVTAQGSEYTAFRRALGTRNLEVVVPALAALPHVDLLDVVEVLELMAEHGDVRYDRSAARFCARLATERRLTVEESRRALALAEVMPLAPQPIADHLRLYCRRELRPV
jgi:uncharacterized protein (DUF2384 family)